MIYRCSFCRGMVRMAEGQANQRCPLCDTGRLSALAFVFAWMLDEAEIEGIENIPEVAS